MEIKMEQSGAKGAFFIEENGTRLAEMTFSRAGEKLLIIDHTDVSDALRGSGAGKKLVAHAVEYARSNALKIMPLCPFAKSVFDKSPEYADVLNT
ncbi:MAG: GNAT family N-acetyltransferase [Bacteroidota bacterium]